MMGARRRQKIVSIFLFNFVYFKSIGGKNMHTFYQLEKKYAFSPLFSSPFNHFFPPTCYLARGAGGGSNRKLYTPENI